MNIQESLNGGYRGLLGEVVDSDIYKMRDVDDVVSINDPKHIHVKGHKRNFKFIPDIIFDLGANVGVYSRYCRKLFPYAKIVSVEPHPDNFKYLSDLDEKTICINKAIGIGNIWRSKGAVNGSGECYLSKSTGLNSIDIHVGYEITKTETITIKELFDEYVKRGDKIIVKMDIEGGENSLIEDEQSIKLLLGVDYFVMEYHHFGITKEDVEKVIIATELFMKRFSKTHNCELNHPMFYASKL